jgi:hypothetical protein
MLDRTIKKVSVNTERWNNFVSTIYTIASKLIYNGQSYMWG